MLCSFIKLQAQGEGSAPAAVQGSRSSMQSWIALRVQRSRSFGFPPQHAKTLRIGGPGFAETLSKHFAVRVARLRIAYRGGEMDRLV
jgi:hypothetical protein